MASTAKSALVTDNGQAPPHDLGMAMYLSEWLEHKKVKGTELADEIGCSRSLVSKWVTKTRALTNITWINKICAFLKITPAQLSKMPPKSHDLLGARKGFESDTDASAEGAEPIEGVEMLEQRADLHAEIDELPDHLVPTALRLVERLKGLKGGPTPRPTKRGSTKA
jgi:DNA-binding Xre family transcriptional regulator